MLGRIGHIGSNKNWKFIRDPGNPIILKELLPANPGQYQAYPPCVWKVGSDINILLKHYPNIYGYTGTDGSAFTETGLLLAKSTDPGAFDYTSIAPGFYCIEAGTHYCFYSGYNSSGGSVASIGLATAANWGDTFVRVDTAPIWTVEDYNSATGDNKANIYPGTIIKKGSTYYFFGTAVNAAFTVAAIVAGTGSSLTDYRLDTKLFDASQFTGSGSYSYLQSPDVFCNPDGYFRLMFSFGEIDGSADSEFLVCINSNRKDAPLGFTTSAAEVMRPNSNAFENAQVYGSCLLKDLSGALITVGGDVMLYYSGHSVSATYLGVTCLATKDPTTIP